MPAVVTLPLTDLSAPTVIFATPLACESFGGTSCAPLSLGCMLWAVIPGESVFDDTVGDTAGDPAEDAQPVAASVTNNTEANK